MESAAKNETWMESAAKSDEETALIPFPEPTTGISLHILRSRY